MVLMSGIAVSLVSSSFVSFGIAVQKASTRYDSNQDVSIYSSTDGRDPAQVKRRKGLYSIGVIYVLVGCSLKLAVYLFLPQVVIAALSSQGIFYSLLLDTFFVSSPNKESKLSVIKTVGSCLLFCFGIVCALLGSAYDLQYDIVAKEDQTISEIISLIRSYRAIFTSLFVVLVMIFCKSLLSRSRSPSVRLLTFCLLTSIVSAFFGSLLKAIAIIAKTLLTNHTDVNVIPWLIGVSFSIVFVGSLKLATVSIALKEFHHSLFLPIYQMGSVLSSMILGLSYYNEYKYTSGYTTDVIQPHVLYFSGITIICVAIASTKCQNYNRDYNSLANVESISIEERRSLLSKDDGTASLSEDINEKSFKSDTNCFSSGNDSEFESIQLENTIEETAQSYSFLGYLTQYFRKSFVVSVQSNRTDTTSHSYSELPSAL
eukprot:gene9003-12145_t